MAIPSKGVRIYWDIWAMDAGFKDAKSYIQSFNHLQPCKVAEYFGITVHAWRDVRKRYGVKIGKHGGKRR